MRHANRPQPTGSTQAATCRIRSCHYFPLVIGSLITDLALQQTALLSR